MMWHLAYGVGWWPMCLVMLLGLGVIWFIVARLARRVFVDEQPPTTPAARSTPLDDVDRRVARGEITPDEYTTLRGLLTEPR